MKRTESSPSGRSPGSFLALAENAPDVICRFDKDFYHLYVNPAIEKVTGFPTSHFIGKTTSEIGMGPEFAEFWNSHIRRAFETEQQVTFEFNFPGSDGMQYFQSYVVPEFDERKKVVSVLSISRDITTIRRSEEERDTFIAMVTHELKTPVTSVKAFAQLLSKRRKDRRYADYLSRMDSQLNRLNNMIGDLLDVTRIRSGKLEFSETTFSFTALVREVIDELDKTANHHQYILKNRGEMTITADRERIRQVLMNLVSNAAKYSPSESKITVSLQKRANEIQCCVTDQGPGISKEKQGRLFQRFSRLTKENHSDSPGLGLGLYISSEIIKQSGGRIWVESEEGKGSTFCFSLPLSESDSKVQSSNSSIDNR